MLLMRNKLRSYAWGSKTGIQWFAGVGEPGAPVAELWMGAHPTAPSGVVAGQGIVGLDEYLSSGSADVVADEDQRLPFLAKFLAVEKALSIQVHPDLETARAEFEKERTAGLPLDSESRTYRDNLHKPEVVYALTPFELMAGLRPPNEARLLVSRLAVGALSPLESALNGANQAEACKAGFAWMMEQRSQGCPWLQDVIARAGELQNGEHGLAYRVLADLAEDYPQDPAVIAPLLMNVAQLKPGEALYTAPRTIHSYLGGMAVEVMASSDNVVRGGLTGKPVLQDELLQIADFAPRRPQLLMPERIAAGILRYAPEGVGDFAFDVVTVDERSITVPSGGPRIAMCIEGDLVLRNSVAMRLPRGDSAFVPSEDGPIEVSGPGRAVVVFSPNFK